MPRSSESARLASVVATGHARLVDRGLPTLDPRCHPRRGTCAVWPAEGERVSRWLVRFVLANAVPLAWSVFGLPAMDGSDRRRPVADPRQVPAVLARDRCARAPRSSQASCRRSGGRRSSSGISRSTSSCLTFSSPRRQRPRRGPPSARCISRRSASGQGIRSRVCGT